MKILFIINPGSGNHSPELQHSIESFCKDLYIEPHIFLVKVKENLIVNIKSKIVTIQPECIVAVGGDGTLSLLAELIFLNQYSIPLGLIPTGSANGMAKELNIPTIVGEALKIISNFKKSRIDIIKVNEYYSIHLSDVGLNAKIIRRFEKEKIRGIWGYGRHLFRELFLARHYHFKISIGDYVIKRKAISVTFANATTYGTGAKLNPLGLIDDGKLEICILKPFPFYYLFTLTYKLFTGSLNDSKYVEILSCKEATINCTRKIMLQVDGEIRGFVKDIRVSVVPQAIEMIVP